MFRKTLVVTAAIAVTLSVAGAALSRGSATPVLTGTDGPGYTITLKKGGRPVRMLEPGRYSITVADKSNIHNFHLKGPGLNKEITTVGFVGTKTVILALKKGTYTFVCDPHFTSMKGSFKVA